MVRFIGHGMLERYSREVAVEGLKPLHELLEELSIPQDLKNILIPVRGARVVQDGDLISNDDVIHLFIALSGG